MRFASLASGSSGNSTYIGSDNTHILVDAGCTRKKILEALTELELDLPDISGIFVTHEHIDHIAALYTIRKKWPIPIYATEGTIEGIRLADKKKVLSDDLFHIIRADEEVKIGDLTVRAIRISHDAREPVGYRITGSESSCAVATDLGCFDDYTVECLKDCKALLLEANHDSRMLETGPYPYNLKMRIAGDKGHLSNDSSGELLIRLLNDNIKGIILGHLSDHNNLPELAYETVRVLVDMSSTPYHSGDFPMYVAGRSSMSPVIEF
ncbi:MBL fold metallo-hydrolase [Butyrivibrio sp. MC2013]|uniref:MBL fold metallo-hydrolase n=1 Tax=Butyrivibrio sp. MC2013 TaxID=1280686 RepID=UPI000405FF3D|nr:MBL fold metallo-hydrolase [Butyrivibrio sp. MC2013]